MSAIQSFACLGDGYSIYSFREIFAPEAGVPPREAAETNLSADFGAPPKPELLLRHVNNFRGSLRPRHTIPAIANGNRCGASSSQTVGNPAEKAPPNSPALPNSRRALSSGWKSSVCSAGHRRPLKLSARCSLGVASRQSGPGRGQV